MLWEQQTIAIFQLNLILNITNFSILTFVFKEKLENVDRPVIQSSHRCSPAVSFNRTCVTGHKKCLNTWMITATLDLSCSPGQVQTLQVTWSRAQTRIPKQAVFKGWGVTQNKFLHSLLWLNSWSLKIQEVSKWIEGKIWVYFGFEKADKRV